MKTKTLRWFTTILLISLLGLALEGCGGSSSDGDSGGSGEPRCDIVANAQYPSFFKVINRLNTGLEWRFIGSYPFGADMRPGECTIFGLLPESYTVELTQCNIGDEGCGASSMFGITKSEYFSVVNGETYTLDITGSFFQ